MTADRFFISASNAIRLSPQESIKPFQFLFREIEFDLLQQLLALTGIARLQLLFRDPQGCAARTGSVLAVD